MLMEFRAPLPQTITESAELVDTLWTIGHPFRPSGHPARSTAGEVVADARRGQIPRSGVVTREAALSCHPWIYVETRRGPACS